MGSELVHGRELLVPVHVLCAGTSLSLEAAMRIFGLVWDLTCPFGLLPQAWHPESAPVASPAENQGQHFFKALCPLYDANVPCGQVIQHLHVLPCVEW